MMEALMLVVQIAGWSCLAWFTLWVLFLAVMALLRAKEDGKMQKGSAAYYLGMLVLVIGFAVDFLVNIGPATLLFLELPRQWTVTERCDSYLNDPGFRGVIARWLCRNLLDPFQIGGHCHP